MAWKMIRHVAFDTETPGLDPYTKKARVFSYSICWEDGTTEVYRLDGKNGPKHRKQLQELFDDTSIVKIAHNHHFDCALIEASGIIVPPETRWEDTMLLSQCLDNLAPAHSLDVLAEKFGGYEVAEDNQIKQAAKIYGSYDKIPNALMEKYQRADAERVMLLWLSLSPILKKNPKAWADYRSEVEVVQPTIAMERRGLKLCRPEAEKLSKFLEAELEKIEDAVPDVCGEYINLSSPKQLERFLYTTLKLPTLMWTKKNQPSTDKDAIEALREYCKEARINQILDLILKRRSYSTGRTMVKTYLTIADENDCIHPGINTNQARTGRQSSSNPNLQNVSKEAALKNRFPVPARKCFQARPGHLLFLVDYAGIEMRLIIEVTQQAEMLQCLKDGGDVHSLAASVFYGEKWADPSQCMAFIFKASPKMKKDFEAEHDAIIEHGGDESELIRVWHKKCQKVMRSAAKNGQFALAYGANIPKVAETLMMSEEEIGPGFAAYASRFPEIANFTRNMTHRAKKDGFILTPFGRKLRIRYDKPYSGANYSIQGLAAGLLKRAEVRIHKLIQQKYPDIFLVMTIHDELIFEIPRSRLSSVDPILREIGLCMTEMPEIKVPLEVEWKMSSYTWDRAKEYKLKAVA